MHILPRYVYISMIIHILTILQLALLGRAAESSATLQMSLRVPFIDVGPGDFCSWAPDMIKTLMNSSQAYTITGCSRTGTVLPSSARRLFDLCRIATWAPAVKVSKDVYCHGQCSAVYDHLRLKPEGRTSTSCQCENAVECVDGSLLPKISELPGETSEAMWKRAIASSNWRFRTAICGNCGCSCWLGCTPDKLACSKEGSLISTANLSYQDVNKYMYLDSLDSDSMAANTRSWIYNLRAERQARDFVAAAEIVTRITEWAARNISEKIGTAATRVSAVALLDGGQASLRSLIVRDENLIPGEPLRIVASVGYIGSLPPNFENCSLGLISTLVPNSDDISVLMDSSMKLRIGITNKIENSVYTLIEATTNGEMGNIFAQCCNMEASWDLGVPSATVRARGERNDETPTQGPGWWVWMLIALCIALFLGLIASLFLGRCNRWRRKPAPPFANFEDSGAYVGPKVGYNAPRETPTAVVDPESGTPILPLIKKNSITPHQRRASISQLSTSANSVANPSVRVVQESPF